MLAHRHPVSAVLLVSSRKSDSDSPSQVCPRGGVGTDSVLLMSFKVSLLTRPRHGQKLLFLYQIQSGAPLNPVFNLHEHDQLRCTTVASQSGMGRAIESDRSATNCWCCSAPSDWPQLPGLLSFSDTNDEVLTLNPCYRSAALILVDQWGSFPWRCNSLPSFFGDG